MANEWLGHNQPSFDQIVEENLLRGLYLTQLNALSRCVRDPRMSARHAQVLATIIERTNAKTGMAFPGRAKLASDVIYYVHGEPQHYSEASIAKTISELIDCGYIMADKRAPKGGGRALSHYVTVAPTVEDLQSQISEWCAKVRGQPKREFPAFKPSDGDTGIVVNNDVENPDGDTGGNVDAGITLIRSDGDTGSEADGDTGIPTVTGRVLTGKEDRGVDLFEEFWQAFPSGRKRAKGEAKTTFEKIVAGKHKVGFATAAELVSGAKLYASSKPDPDYTPMPTTWLNQGRWMDDVADKSGEQRPWWTDKAKLAAVSETQWRGSIARHAAATWNVEKLGPAPGHPECIVPQAIIKELALTEKYDPRGFARAGHQAKEA